MNFYALIILFAIIAGFILNLIANLLNLRMLGKELPVELKDVYDSSIYNKSQKYIKERTRFGIFTSALSLCATIMFWFFGGFPFIESLTAHFIDDSIVLRGLFFFGIIGAAAGLLSLPSSIYSTFVIEEKYGFNKTTPKTFAIDFLKSILLSVLLGAPVLALVIYFFDTLGEYAWLAAWAGIVIFTLFVQYIAPTWIMPLFNKFKPLEQGELRSAIIEFAQKVSFPLDNVFVMDGSKRSSKANAYFTGFGKNKRIVLFDTLIAKHSVQELVAILAHEIGHYKKRHILQGTVISIAHTGILLWLMSLFLYNQDLYAAFLMDVTPIYAGFIFFGMLYSPAELFLSFGMNLLSRKNEYQADRFAADNIGNPEPLIVALKKLHSDNLSNPTPHPFYVSLNYSHPPLLERIRKLFL